MCLNNHVLFIFLIKRHLRDFSFCETESMKLEMQGICENVELTITYMQKKTEFLFFDNRAHSFWFEEECAGSSYIIKMPQMLSSRTVGLVSVFFFKRTGFLNLSITQGQ